MSKKRFEVTFNNNDFHLKDNETGDEFKIIDEEICYNYIADKWNTLHEENQKLKQENYELEKIRYSIFKTMNQINKKNNKKVHTHE